MEPISEVEAVIFDLGGVLLDLDYRATSKAFHQLGFRDFDILYSQASQSGLFDSFETGAISEQAFFDNINSLAHTNHTQENLKMAWNAMLLEFNEDALHVVSRVSSRVPVFLFSNTNETHFNRFQEKYRLAGIGHSFDALFTKTYYSHLLGKRKPTREAFEQVLKENRLNPATPVFIDDSAQHVHGASVVGIQSYHLTEQLESMFSRELPSLLT